MGKGNHSLLSSEFGIAIGIEADVMSLQQFKSEKDMTRSMEDQI